MKITQIAMILPHNVNVKQHRFIQHKYLHVTIEVRINDNNDNNIHICIYTGNKARSILH